MSRVLVLGATSSIGRALTRQLAEAGKDLTLAGRDLRELELVASDARTRHGVRATVLRFEATDPADHRARLTQALAEHGDELEGAYWCIGYLGDQETAAEAFDEAERVLTINLEAAVSALTLLSGHLEAAGQGYLCAISSVAGDRGRMSNYTYGAAKGGLSTYLQGLRNRLHHAGVQVTTIKPGFVDSKMTYGRDDMFLVASPERVATAMIEAVEAGRDVVYVPWFWRPVLSLLRAAPEGLMKRTRL